MSSGRVGDEPVVLGDDAAEDGEHEGGHGAGSDEEGGRRLLGAVEQIHAEDAGDDGARGQRQRPHLHEE